VKRREKWVRYFAHALEKKAKRIPFRFEEKFVSKQNRRNQLGTPIRADHFRLSLWSGSLNQLSSSLTSLPPLGLPLKKLVDGPE
jgi:hypothetical protein